jgi:hypothetical protein
LDKHEDGRLADQLLPNLPNYHCLFRSIPQRMERSVRIIDIYGSDLVRIRFMPIANPLARSSAEGGSLWIDSNTNRSRHYPCIAGAFISFMVRKSGNAGMLLYVHPSYRRMATKGS